MQNCELQGPFCSMRKYSLIAFMRSIAHHVLIYNHLLAVCRWVEDAVLRYLHRRLAASA